MIIQGHLMSTHNIFLCPATSVRRGHRALWFSIRNTDVHTSARPSIKIYDDSNEYPQHGFYGEL